MQPPTGPPGTMTGSIVSVMVQGHIFGMYQVGPQFQAGFQQIAQIAPDIHDSGPPMGGPAPPGLPGMPPAPGQPAAPPCIHVVSRWVTEICLMPLGVMIKFKNVKHHVFTVHGCLYPGTGLADFNWILAQPSKGKAVWARFYYRPYILMF